MALQTKNVDIMECCDMISHVTTLIRGLLDNANEKFREIFLKLDELLLEQHIPIVAARSSLSADKDEVERRLRETTFKPFLSNILKEFNTRFGNTFAQIANCYAIIPSHMRRGKRIVEKYLRVLDVTI